MSYRFLSFTLCLSVSISVFFISIKSFCQQIATPSSHCCHPFLQPIHKSDMRFLCWRLCQREGGGGMPWSQGWLQHVLWQPRAAQLHKDQGTGRGFPKHADATDTDRRHPGWWSLRWRLCWVSRNVPGGAHVAPETLYKIVPSCLFNRMLNCCEHNMIFDVLVEDAAREWGRRGGCSDTVLSLETSTAQRGGGGLK